MTTEQRTMGEHNACGEGHIQVDVDRTHSDAYQKKDLRYRWLAALAAPDRDVVRALRRGPVPHQRVQVLERVCWWTREVSKASGAATER